MEFHSTPDPRSLTFLMRHNRAMRIGAFLFALLSVVLMAPGCRPQTTFTGGTLPPKVYRTAASLSPSATEIVGSRAFNVAIVGKTPYCNFPATQVRVPIVMIGVKPNYEKLAELQPDIILYDDALFSQADLDKLKDLKIETYAISGHTIEEFVDCVYRLGSKLHAESNMSEYVDNIESAVSAAAGEPLPKPLKVAVISPGEGSEHLIAGKSSFVADMVRKAQGDPVGPDADKFVPLNAESLVSMNPDFIVCAGKADAIRKDPRLQSINAIKNHQVLEAEEDKLVRRGGRVDGVIRSLHNHFMAAAQGGTESK
jgi:iron complex transport system substrate-binding protein